MDGYKKLISSQKMRMAILKTLSFVPDKIMIQLQYRIKLGRKLALKNPKRYTEKIQWYKLHYRNPIMIQCVDKYAVRDYIKKKGYQSTLTKLYGVYHAPDAIDFGQLPDKYIIKTTNGSGTNIICRNNNEIDVTAIRKKLQDYMNRPHISAGREWAYYGVKNRIVVEELLEDKSQPGKEIVDYKFLCFSGRVFCVVVDIDRFTNHKRNFYSTNWKRLSVSSDHENFEPDINKPENLSEMVEIAEVLSEDFPAVRVDLYNVNGKVYFGELTFYPWSGYVQFEPDDFDFMIGEKFVLPDINVGKGL